MLVAVARPSTFTKVHLPRGTEMEKMLRGVATLIIMVGGLMLSSAQVASADMGGCPSGSDGLFCGWCGDMPGCTLDHCVYTPGGGPCGCTYNC